MNDPADLIEGILKLSRGHYTNNPGFQSPPTVYAIKESEIVGILELDFTNDFTKTLSIHGVKMYLRSSGCDASAFITEAWMAIRSADNVYTVRASQDPQRVEMFMIELSSKDRYITRAFEMIRGEGGEVIDFKLHYATDSADGGPNMMVHSRYDFFDGMPKETVQ